MSTNETLGDLQPPAQLSDGGGKLAGLGNVGGEPGLGEVAWEADELRAAREGTERQALPLPQGIQGFFEGLSGQEGGGTGPDAGGLRLGRGGAAVAEPQGSTRSCG